MSAAKKADLKRIGARVQVIANGDKGTVVAEYHDHAVKVVWDGSDHNEYRVKLSELEECHEDELCSVCLHPLDDGTNHDHEPDPDAESDAERAVAYCGICGMTHADGAYAHVRS